MKKSIFILSVIFCVACQKVDDVHNKNADQRGTNEEVYPENLSDIGYYHNEILKNYISISKTPSLLSTNSESDDFIKLMADTEHLYVWRIKGILQPEILINGLAILLICRCLAVNIAS